MTRLDELEEAVEVRLWADGDEAREPLYQKVLRSLRPSAEDIDYIDRRVQAERAARAAGQPSPRALPYVPPHDAIMAFHGRTPMARLYNCINRVDVDWQTDPRDPIKAYVLACFSELAYLHLTDQELAARDRYKLFEPSVTRAALRNWPLRLDLVAIMARADIPITIIETKKFVFLVARVHGYIVIAVRGTHGFRDILLDLEALKNPARNGFYHRGFGDEAAIALPDLVKAVGDKRPIYITGHSLGAAVASILTQIWPDQSRVRTPYLFASPRFGTPAAARRLPRYAYVRPLDPIPHAPPRWLGYSDQGAQTFSLPPGSSRRGGWASLWAVLRSRSLSEHSIEGHRRLLGEVVGEVFPERVYVDALVAHMSGRLPPP
ncbi:MAG TPA: lipase family protein [Allosphingosinicella sp.]|jgi:hypothetical protein